MGFELVNHFPSGADNATPVDFSLVDLSYTGISAIPPGQYVKVTSVIANVLANDGGANYGAVDLSNGGLPFTFTNVYSGPETPYVNDVEIPAGRDWKYQVTVTYDLKYLGFPVQYDLTKVYPTAVGYYTFQTAVAGPVLLYPDDELANVYLNEDWLMNFTWEDDDPYAYSAYTVHFNGVAQNDRSRYSIVAFLFRLGQTLEYDTTYEWFVRKDLGGGDYLDSDTWTFTTLTFAPPAHSTRERIIYGEELWDSDAPPGDNPPGGGGSPGGGTGETETIPSGENNQITVQRLIAAVKNTIFYENK